MLREVLQAQPDLDVVAVAQDAEEAIHLAERHTPHVAILDVCMPGGGAHAAREIRRRCPRTRIMAFTAYGDAGAVEEMRRAGVSEYLLKGLSNTDIVAAVPLTAPWPPPDRRLTGVGRRPPTVNRRTSSDMCHTLSQPSTGRCLDAEPLSRKASRDQKHQSDRDRRWIRRSPGGQSADSAR
ncbi:response regulator transcription factor [Nonomuraea sp. NPDC047897]|uniref:response regulator n=1 Tax=Nonomuraea sp. NPDC047897 TaxID=3364346 RepID=UPI0037173B82